jgi:hypothetical protein
VPHLAESCSRIGYIDPETGKQRTQWEDAALLGITDRGEVWVYLTWRDDRLTNDVTDAMRSHAALTLSQGSIRSA